MLWKNLWNLWRSRVVFPENSLWKTHFPRDNLSACPKHRIFIHNFVIFNFILIIIGITEETVLKFRLLFGSSVINLPGETANHIEKASGDELRVLIAVAGGAGTSSKEIADALGMPEAEAEAAISFWRGTGVLEIYADDDKNPTASRNRRLRKNEKSEKPDEPSAQAYSGNDVERIFAENGRLKETAEMSQALLGKGSLTPAETKIIVYLSDHLRLDNEFILLLISYCVKIGKGSLRYIEQTAIGLYDKGINTVAALEEYIKREDEKRSLEYKVRTLFGIGERALIKTEQECLENWVKLGISFELIEYGYEKMMKSPKVTRPSFSYENKMLTDWVASGMRTPEAVAEYEKSDKKKPAGKREAGFDLDEFFNLAASRGAGGDNK